MLHCQTDLTNDLHLPYLHIPPHDGPSASSDEHTTSTESQHQLSGPAEADPGAPVQPDAGAHLATAAARAGRPAASQEDALLVDDRPRAESDRHHLRVASSKTTC